MKDGKNFYYFDSYGFPASEEIEDQIGEYIYSTNQLQNIDSSSCGYFCIAWMPYMSSRKNKESTFADFLKLSSEDTKNNEVVFKSIFSIIGLKRYKIA